MDVQRLRLLLLAAADEVRIKWPQIARSGKWAARRDRRRNGRAKDNENYLLMASACERKRNGDYCGRYECDAAFSWQRFDHRTRSRASRQHRHVESDDKTEREMEASHTNAGRKDWRFQHDGAFGWFCNLPFGRDRARQHTITAAA